MDVHEPVCIDCTNSPNMHVGTVQTRETLGSHGTSIASDRRRKSLSELGRVTIEYLGRGLFVRFRGYDSQRADLIFHVPPGTNDLRPRKYPGVFNLNLLSPTTLG